MRTYVSPIGYNSTSVVRPVLSRGLDSGDKIVLLRPSDDADDQRAREAVEDIRRLVTEIEPDVQLDVERITHGEYSTAVLECSDVIRNGTGKRIVNLGGGARDVLVPLTTAALAHVDLVSTIVIFSDVDGSVRELDPPQLSASVPGNVLTTLTAIGEYDGLVSIPTLTERLDRSKSSITRHVNQLADEGLVRTEKHGRTKVVQLTFAGELHLRTRNLDVNGH